MSLNIAAVRSASCSPLYRVLVSRDYQEAANDNAGLVVNDRIMRAALRHFAEHGLGAARVARERAEAAFFAGDRAQYDWWRALCRTLDRRMVEQLDNRTGSTTPSRGA